MTVKQKSKYSKVAWGLFWILIAGLILANSFGGFVQLNVWSIVIAALALVILFHCLVRLSLAPLPIPIAALYYIFQVPLELPFIAFWTLAPVTLLVTCGLCVLLPRRLGSSKHFGLLVLDDGKRHKGCRNHGEAHIEEGDDENNPYISVNFGAISRYLHSDCLQTADLNCAFGSLEVYFDNVQLAPDGAEVYANCKFGAIEIYVPGHWRVIDQMSTTLGSAEVDRRLQAADADAPTLTITGHVSFGSIEVNRIKGS